MYPIEKKDKSTYSPIVLFGYRRPEHLRKTISSLLQCEEVARSPIYVFIDGPKNSSELDDVKLTQQVAIHAFGDRAQYKFRDMNFGLSRSVIDGISEVFKEHDRAIVIEDDLIVNQSFLNYMNSSLSLYEDNPSVYQISGYAHVEQATAAECSAYFLPLTTSWGWATWKRAWVNFDQNACGWRVLLKDSDLRYRFNLAGGYDYTTMLARHFLGKCDSWAVRWYWTVFKNNGLVLYPAKSLVVNHGMDGSGSHGKGIVRRERDARTVNAAYSVVYPENTVVDQLMYSITLKAHAQVNRRVYPIVVDLIRRYDALINLFISDLLMKTVDQDRM